VNRCDISRNQIHAVETVMRTVFLLLVTCIPVLAVAQNEPPAARSGAQGETLTRSASKYHDLELRLLQAQQNQDQATVTSLLTEDFEEWTAGAGNATPRADWLKERKKSPSGNYRLRDFSTREFGDVAVVSFTLHPSSPAKPIIFVVDVWQQASGLLAVRYETEAKVKVKAGQGPPAHKG
jgi:Domain of unknown function (DUF4440)